MSWSNPPFVNHSSTVFANNTSRSGPNLTSAVKTPTSSLGKPLQDVLELRDVRVPCREFWIENGP